MAQQPTCPECGGRITTGGTGVMTTAVGFASPPGHNHDDNCRVSHYGCVNGHQFALSRRNRCTATNPDGTPCTWVGKDECFCHPGKKVDEWPVAAWPG